MKKLLQIFIITVAMGSLFAACSEEEVRPEGGRGEVIDMRNDEDW